MLSLRSQPVSRSSSPAQSLRAILVTLSLLLLVPVIAPPSSQAVAGDVGYQDQSYTGSGGAPTADKSQSKLWYNDGLWWADMFDTVSRTYHIFRLDRSTESWVDTGTRLDNRASTRADLLWSGGHLYAASNVKAADSASNVTGQPARLYRYSYSTTSKTYTLDSGFPVPINNVSSESLTFDRDSRGVLWATWTQGQSVYVNSSVGSDSAWGTPFVIPIAGATGLQADDVSALAAFGTNRVGVMWSNQATSTFYFATHRDGDAAGTWTGRVALSTPHIADDHMNLKQLDGDAQGHLYAAVKTSYDGSGAPQTAPQIELLALDPSTGTWSAYIYGTLADCHTRPMIEIDSTNQILHMFATAPSSGGCPFAGAAGSIYEKTTPLNNISFAPGRGAPVIQDAASPNMNNVTGTKQNITAATGLVILAGNDATSRYWHADVALSQPPPSVSFTASPTSGVAPLTVNFTATSTGGVSTWSWNFGDGATSTVQNASHTYTSPGTYPVTLTGTTSSGTTASSTGTVTVSAASASYSSAVLADGPVGYWRLGETSGTSVADTTGSPPGSLVGGVTEGVAGVAGDGNTAFGFNGTNGYVTIGDRANLDFTSQGFAVEAWVKPNTISTVSGAVLQKGDASGYPGWQYRLAMTSAGKWRGTVFVGSTNITVTDSSTPSTTAWTHLALVRNAGQITLYVNGAAVAATTFSGNVNTSVGMLAIGRSGANSTNYFNGAVDEVAIYPTALSSSQVLAHYNAATGK